MDVEMWELVAYSKGILDVAKFISLTALSLLSSCKISVPIVFFTVFLAGRKEPKMLFIEGDNESS
jgi:hypothetical protein